MGLAMVKDTLFLEALLKLLEGATNADLVMVAVDPAVIVAAIFLTERENVCLIDWAFF